LGITVRVTALVSVKPPVAGAPLPNVPIKLRVQVRGSAP